MSPIFNKKTYTLNRHAVGAGQRGQHIAIHALVDHAEEPQAGARQAALILGFPGGSIQCFAETGGVDATREAVNIGVLSNAG